MPAPAPVAYRGPVPARAAYGMSALSWARLGREGPALGLRACLEDEEGHGRGRRWQRFRSLGGVCLGAEAIRVCRERTREGSSAE